MKSIVTILIIVCMMREMAALSADLCNQWKETKEKLMDKLKSPATSYEEQREVLGSLFQMYLYEKKNPKHFVYSKTEKTIDAVLYPGLRVLGQLARSHGTLCVL